MGEGRGRGKRVLTTLVQMFSVTQCDYTRFSAYDAGFCMACQSIETQRLVYLITYSRADTVKFPTRESFGEAVLEAWKFCGIDILQWVVCIEAHANADCHSHDQMNKYHFHMAVKLRKRGRWLQVKKYLNDQFGIQVHFSDHHNTYYSAYKYVTKEDSEAVHSSGHPDLTSAPKTEAAIASKKRKDKKDSRATTKKRKEERLTVYDVCKIIQEKGITSRLQLIALATAQEREGKKCLVQFIANRGHKAVDEALCLAKEFSEVESKLKRSKKTRMEILHEAKERECVATCEGKWFEAAIQVLGNQEIMPSVFCQAVYDALEKGRGKFRNVYLHGSSNCGKSFILSPLKVIFNTFCNPATGSFAWIGAEEAEVIFLNDFRWEPKLIAWADLLQALEGDIVHLPAPKTFCKRDLELTEDTPFFATADAPLVLIRKGTMDRTNTEMMNVRWRYFHFWKKIPQAEQKHFAPCGRCFARFILSYVNNESQ